MERERTKNEMWPFVWLDFIFQQPKIKITSTHHRNSVSLFISSIFVLNNAHSNTIQPQQSKRACEQKKKKDRKRESESESEMWHLYKRITNVPFRIAIGRRSFIYWWLHCRRRPPCVCAFVLLLCHSTRFFPPSKFHHSSRQFFSC